MHIILFLIAIIASTIGAISGIGGGIIIKPVLDSLGTLTPDTINFLSGCTVLSMALSSFVRNYGSEQALDYHTTIYLTIGACIGGILGKIFFSLFTGNIALIQSTLLLLINLGVLAYYCNKDKIKNLTISSRFSCMLIGLGLGGISSFLGIGGGPINIAILSYFFSTLPKVTARNSLFIILFSQLFTLATTLITNTVPQLDSTSLILMCSGGVVGALIGSIASRIFDNRRTELFFMFVLVFLIFLNLYNLSILFLSY